MKIVIKKHTNIQTFKWWVYYIKDEYAYALCGFQSYASAKKERLLFLDYSEKRLLDWHNDVTASANKTHPHLVPFFKIKA